HIDQGEGRVAPCLLASFGRRSFGDVGQDGGGFLLGRGTAERGVIGVGKYVSVTLVLLDQATGPTVAELVDQRVVEQNERLGRRITLAPLTHRGRRAGTIERG